MRGLCNEAGDGRRWNEWPVPMRHLPCSWHRPLFRNSVTHVSWAREKRPTISCGAFDESRAFHVPQTGRFEATYT